MNWRRHILAAIALAFTLTACIGAEAKAPEIPESLIGTWKVTKVYWPHDGPWPDGTPKQWFLGMSVFIEKNSITATPYHKKNYKIPPVIFKNLKKISSEKNKVTKDMYIRDENPFLLYKITGSYLYLFDKSKFTRYLLSFSIKYRKYLNDPGHKNGALFEPIAIYVDGKDNLLIPNYPLSAAFLILTRVPNPVS